MDKATIAKELRKLAEHLERLTATVRTHGGHGWTYDDEIPILRAAAAALDSANAVVSHTGQHPKPTE